MLSIASPLASIPDPVSARIKASGLGYVAKWVPQVSLLQHEVPRIFTATRPCAWLNLLLQATGWFLSHCGQNSLLESLSAGVPLYENRDFFGVLVLTILLFVEFAGHSVPINRATRLIWLSTSTSLTSCLK